MPPVQPKYIYGTSTPYAAASQSKSPGAEKSAWINPPDSEETIFLERRMSHYRAMLKLTLAPGDRFRLIRMLSDAELKLALRKLYLAKVEVFTC